VSLVDEHPLVVEADAKLADLERRKTEFEANVAPLAAEDAAAQDAYEKAVDDALLRGGAMPSQPVRKIPPGRDAELRMGFMQEQQQLTDERRRAVAEAYPEVLRQARAQATKLVKGARPTVEKLTAFQGQVGDLLAAVNVCRAAVNAESLDGHTEFQDAKLDLQAFIGLALTGGDPTSLLHLPGAPPPLQGSRDGLTIADIAQLTRGELTSR
jgi:hypothetical protein